MTEHGSSNYFIKLHLYSRWHHGNTNLNPLKRKHLSHINNKTYTAGFVVQDYTVFLIVVSSHINNKTYTQEFVAQTILYSL